MYSERLQWRPFTVLWQKANFRRLTSGVSCQSNVSFPHGRNAQQFGVLVTWTRFAALMAVANQLSWQRICQFSRCFVENTESSSGNSYVSSRHTFAKWCLWMKIILDFIKSILNHRTDSMSQSFTQLIKTGTSTAEWVWMHVICLSGCCPPKLTGNSETTKTLQTTQEETFEETRVPPGNVQPDPQKRNLFCFAWEFCSMRLSFRKTWESVKMLAPWKFFLAFHALRNRNVFCGNL